MSAVSPINRAFAGVMLLTSAILVAGCDKEGGAKLAFSHSLHVQDNGMACADCHGKAKEGRFGAAGHDACKDCHGDWMDEKVVEEKTCGKCHKVKHLKNELAALYAAPDKIPLKAQSEVFVHTDALSNRCMECHGSLMDKNLVLVPRMTRDEKIEIRNRVHAGATSCTTCHADMDPKTPPPSHKQGWTQRHGILSGQDEKSCTVCHSEPSCRECHQVTQPASHNNLWRLKTHGVQAAWNRVKCLVCHEEDSCAACHAETRPQSHNAGWRDNHCFQCHTSKERGVGCALCHEGTIESHPNPHPGGWRSQHCNTCHPGSPETAQCGVCHGGDVVGGHPNPHSAGWRAEHCNTCHPGSSELQKCAICHGSGSHPNPHPAGWVTTHCNSCHDGPQAQSCAQCHEGVTSLATHPDPHSVGWRQKHCYSCHPGSTSNECSPCHDGGNSLLVHQSFWPPVHNRFSGSAEVNLCHYCHKP